MTVIDLTDRDALHRAVEAMSALEAIGLDTETTGLDPWTDRLRLIQLATPDTVYLLDADSGLDHGPLVSLLEAPRPVKVLHNAKFDAKFLHRRYGLTLAGLFDTMLASQLLGSDDKLGHSLSALAQRHLGEGLDKTWQRADWSGPLTPEQKAYAAKDAAILLPLRQRLKAALLARRLGPVAALEFAVAPILGLIELAGVRLDRAAWQEVADQRRLELTQLAGELTELLQAADPQLALFPGLGSINLNSAPQLVRALGQLGLPVADTDDLTLGPLAADHPVVATLLDYRHAAKAVSSYGDQFLTHVHPDTGRIHATFHQLGASTGRMAVSQPNLQQIPNQERYRACFVPEPDHQLIIADYSQIELRILAEVSGDPQLQTAFDTGVDLHRLTASQLFGMPLDQVSKDQRQAAKALNFGLVYGMGPAGLATRLRIPLTEARGLIDRYFATYPGVRDWLAAAARHAVQHGECWTLGGRHVRFGIPEAGNRKAISAAERFGKNAPLQGTSADITKRAVVLVHQALAGRGTLIHVVHDELVVETPRTGAAHVAEAVRQAMVAAGQAYLKRIPVVVDVGLADSWLK